MLKITSVLKTSFLYSELPSPILLRLSPSPPSQGTFVLVDRSCAQGYIPRIFGQKPVNRDELMLEYGIPM